MLKMLALMQVISTAFFLVTTGCDNSYCDGPDAQNVHGDENSGGGCSSPNHEMELKTKVNEGKDSSSAQVEIIFNRGSEDKEASDYWTPISRGDTPFENEIAVRLEWSCDIEGQKKTNEMTVTKAKGNSKATTNLTGLPAQPKEDGNMIVCELSAEAQISFYVHKNKEDGELLEAGKSFEILPHGYNASLPMVTLEITPTRGDTQSHADVKVSLAREDGEAFKQGDSLFDKVKNVVVDGYCNRGDNTTAKATIAAGKTSAETRLILPGVSSDSALKCFSSVSVYIEDKEVLTPSQVPFFLGEQVLTVSVEDDSKGKALSYRVTENNQALSDDVELTINEGCGPLVRMDSSRTSITTSSTSTMITAAKSNSDNNSAVENRIFALGHWSSGKQCTLVALTGIKTGSSKLFSVNNSFENYPFELNKETSTITTRELENGEREKYSGKIWVFIDEDGDGTGDLVAYLNASNTDNAKLQNSAAANADDAKLDSSKQYIVFAEVNGVLHVFRI